MKAEPKRTLLSFFLSAHPGGIYMKLNPINRDIIIQCMADQFLNDDRVFAFWLEGSDGTNRLDVYSDLDIVLDVADGNEEAVYAQLEQTLQLLGRLDISFGPERQGPKLWYKVYHIEHTPPTLLLDVTIQSHSREFAFTVENEYEVPKIIFDKASVIRFKHADFDAERSSHRNRITHLEGIFGQQIRAVKYANRNLFLEAHAYYHKFVLNPLIELPRMQYTPLITDYYLVHISQHLPEDVVRELEVLYRLNDTADILRNIDKANTWFHSAKAALLHS
jgi:hypothetical protein